MATAAKRPADSGIRSEFFQSNFTGGEFSPLLNGRVDIGKYRDAVETMDNFVVFPHGPADKRQGTRHITSVKTQSAVTRLIPFVFNTVQSYVIEFGNQYCRFYKDEGQIASSGSPYEIATNFLTAEIPDITYIQSADILYLCHPNHRPQQLTRTADTAWTITNYDYGDGPYDAINTTATTITPSGTTGSVTLTASTAIFQSAAIDVGRMVRIEQSSEWGAAIITGFTSTTIVSATVIDDSSSSFLNTTASSSWRLGSWYGPNNWPSAVPTFFENRLVFAATTAEPNAFWASRSSDFNSHKPTDRDGTVVDSHGINRLITDNQVNAIFWLAVDNSFMFAGTSDGPFKIWSGSQGSPLTPSALKVDKQTEDGAGDLAPIKAGDAVLYVGRAKTKVRELLFSFENDKHLSANLALLSEHLPRTGIAQIEYVEEPDGIVYVRLTNGNLVSFTYKRDEKVIAWQSQTLGGTDVSVESLAAIPSVDGKSNTLYLIVKRTINSAVKRYVEFLEERFEPSSATDKDDAFFVDSGATYDSSSTSTITGLSHLEGQVVQILADGATHPDKTVSSAQITLDRAASVVHVGLKYTSTIRTLPIEVPTPTGTSQGKTKRISQLLIRVYMSLGGQYGPDASTLDRILYRSGSTPMDSSPPLHTGDKILSFNGKYDTLAQYSIVHDEPLPFTLLAISPRLETQKR
jgi:hypothetical protein